MNTKLVYQLKLTCRWALGFVWIWEGLVPKIFWTTDTRQPAMVAKSGLYWPDPETFLMILGGGMVVAGVILCIGWMERAAVLTVSVAMTILIFLVAGNNPELVADLDAGIAKDACLYACAWVVWKLAPIVPTKASLENPVALA